jgi:hypothetical protein
MAWIKQYCHVKPAYEHDQGRSVRQKTKTEQTNGRPQDVLMAKMGVLPSSPLFRVVEAFRCPLCSCFCQFLKQVRLRALV